MKPFTFLIICLANFNLLLPQEIIVKDIKTDVSEVIVFIEGAQVTKDPKN